jgi:hypothetical protein
LPRRVLHIDRVVRPRQRPRRLAQAPIAGHLARRLHFPQNSESREKEQAQYYQWAFVRHLSSVASLKGKS